MLRNAVGGGRVSYFQKKSVKKIHVWINVISVTSGWVGVENPVKKGYVTLEWSQYITVIGITC